MIKKYSLIAALAIAGGSAYGQVQVDKNIQLTGKDGDRALTGLSVPADGTGAVSASTIQKSYLTYAISTNTGNAYAVTLPVSAGTYQSGMIVTFRASAQNTGGITLNVNGMGIKTVFRNVNEQLESGDIKVGQIVSVIYDGTNFQVISQLSQVSGFTGVLSGDVSGPQGATLIVDNAVTTNKIANGSVTTAKLANGAVTTVKLADDAVATAKILDANVTTPKLADDAVTTAKILNSNVTTSKIADGNVTTAKLADLNVTTAKLADLNVTTAKIADLNVTTNKLVDLSVTTNKIANAGVTTTKIADANVTTVKIADANVTTAKIADGSVTTTKIADGAVTSLKIFDGTIVNADISPSAAIAYGKLTLNNSIVASDLTSNAVITAKIADGSVTTPKLADDAVTTIKIANNAVTNGKILDNSITTSKITDANVTTAKLADDAVTTSKITNLNVTAAKLADDAVTTTKIANLNVTTAKLVDLGVTTAKLADANVTTAKLADGSVTDAKVANGISYSKLTGTPASLPPSGSAGGDLTGAYPNPSIGPNAVTTAKINDGAVATAKLADGAVATAKLADGAVATAKLADASVTTIKIADNSVTNGKILDNSVGTSKINDAAVTITKIADANVTTTKIADANVTTAKIADDAVTTVKIANLNVTTSKLIDLGVTTAKIADANVTNAKLADGSVTDAKVANGISYSKLTGTPTSLPPNGSASGDLTGAYPNPTVANSAITSAKILDGTVVNADVSPTAAIAYSKLSLTNAIVTGDLTNSSVTVAKISATGTADGTTFLRGDGQWATPAGGMTPSYLGAANTTGAIIAVVLGGTNIPLPNAQNANGITPDGSNTSFAIGTTGTYMVTFQIRTTTAVLLSTRVTLNGVTVSALNLVPSAAQSRFFATGIVNLTAGDILSLQGYGLLGAVTLDGGAGANLVIQRIN